MGQSCSLQSPESDAATTATEVVAATSPSDAVLFPLTPRHYDHNASASATRQKTPSQRRLSTSSNPSNVAEGPDNTMNNNVHAIFHEWALRDEQRLRAQHQTTLERFDRPVRQTNQVTTNPLVAGNRTPRTPRTPHKSRIVTPRTWELGASMELESMGTLTLPSVHQAPSGENALLLQQASSITPRAAQAMYAGSLHAPTTPILVCVH